MGLRRGHRAHPGRGRRVCGVGLVGDDCAHRRWNLSNSAAGYDHLDSGDPDGLPGMHVLHGPVLAFGSGDSAPLRDRAVDNIVLSALRETLLPRLTGSLHGVKLLFGGRAGDEVAEVRVDHAYDEASSRGLGGPPMASP